jgi:hypothetical protein
LRGISVRRIIVGVSFLIFLGLFFPGTAGAQPQGHIGNYCVECHNRFSADQPYASDLSVPMTNPRIRSIFPCSKEVCHPTNPVKFPQYAGKIVPNRWTLHLRICGNCHPMKNGSYDIHRIHRKFEELNLSRPPVDCALCHATPEGYNSSIVEVPPRPAAGLGDPMRPPWGGDCGYCHPSARGAERLHQVHKPVLAEMCDVCHGRAILERKDLIYRVTSQSPHAGGPKLDEGGERRFSLIQEFLFLFYNIAEWLEELFQLGRRV